MKNTLLFLAFCLTNGLSLLAQKTPPTAVVAAFNKQFTTAIIQAHELQNPLAIIQNKALIQTFIHLKMF